jgi:hypothetical protein
VLPVVHSRIDPRPPQAVVVLEKGMSILLNFVRTHEGGTNEVRHSKAAQEFRLLRHELLLGENIFLAQFREAFDCLHNVFHGERSRAQSVCVGLVNRVTYSLSEMPRTASSRLLSVRFDCPGGVKASFQNSPSAFFRPRRIASSLMASVFAFSAPASSASAAGESLRRRFISGSTSGLL